MGHNTLGVLPRTVYWQSVVQLVADGAPIEEVVAASAQATETMLLKAVDDPAFVEAVRLLLAIPAAARSGDFAAGLRDLELSVPDQPELLDIVTAAGRRLDDQNQRGRTDLGELAGRALCATLSDSIGERLPGLFEATPEDVQREALRLSWNTSLSDYSRRFFSRLVADSLSYWLDRTLADHIGDGQRFATVADRADFDRELDCFSWESSRIIREFSAGWYGKTLFRDGGFTTRSAAAFGAVAMKKIVDDLRTRRNRNV